MYTRNGTPDRSTRETEPLPPQSRVRVCRDAKVLLCCLGVQACVVARSVFFDIRPDWLDALFATLAVASTIGGVWCCVSAIQRRGYANRAIGIAGTVWFAIVILLAIIQS